MSFANLDAYADRTARVLATSEARIVVASSRLQNVLWGLVDKVATLERLVVVETLHGTSATSRSPSTCPR
ncbi:MAG: hypothetical protein R3F59_11385 [Myxococcota bacterium]